MVYAQDIPLEMVALLQYAVKVVCRSCVLKVIAGAGIGGDVPSALWVERLPVLVELAFVRRVPHHLVIDVDQIWTEAGDIAKLYNFLWYCDG